MNFVGNVVTNNDRSQQQAGAGASHGQTQYQVEEEAFRDAGPANNGAGSDASSLPLPQAAVSRSTEAAAAAESIFLCAGSFIGRAPELERVREGSTGRTRVT